MIVHDSWWWNGSARSTIIDYREPFDQGLKYSDIFSGYGNLSGVPVMWNAAA